MDQAEEFDRRSARWEEALAGGTFEDLHQSLEETVLCLDEGRLSLEHSLRCYELGARLAERCDRLLAEAELRISRLDDIVARVGQPVEDFEDLDLEAYDE